MDHLYFSDRAMEDEVQTQIGMKGVHMQLQGTIERISKEILADMDSNRFYSFVVPPYGRQTEEGDEVIWGVHFLRIGNKPLSVQIKVPAMPLLGTLDDLIRNQITHELSK